jgi:flagellar motor switch protein FliM
MAQVLSQAEVDALLSGLDADVASLASSESNCLQISVRQFQVLKQCHDALCRELSSAWGSLTNVGVEVHLASIDECAYEDFLKSVKESCISIAELDEKNGQLLCAVSTSIILPIVQCMLGSDISREDTAHKKLTDVELKLASRAIDLLFTSYEKSWSSDQTLKLTAQKVSNEATGLPITPYKETVVVIQMGVSIANAQGSCCIAWPLELLNELIPPSESNTQELSVQLPAFELPAERLEPLEVGQLIETEFDAQQPVQVLINGSHLFSGSIGAVEGRKAVKLIQPITDKDESQSNQQGDDI